MTEAYHSTLIGDRLAENPIPEYTAESAFVTFFDQRTEKRIGLSTAALSKSVCAVGDPGTGKSNTLNMLTHGILEKCVSPGDANLFIFDIKGDYHRVFFHKIPKDRVLVIGAGAEYRGITAYHNLFAEIMGRDKEGKRLIYEGEESDQRAAEIAESLFKDLKSETQPVFPSMAREIVTDIIICLMRSYGGWPGRENPNEDQRQLNNLKLKQFFQKTTTRELCTLFDNKFMRDFRGAKSYIEKDSNQTQGVISYIRTCLNSMLSGPFAKADPAREFSMQEIVTECSGKVVFLEFDLSADEHLSPYYALMIDQALKHGLGGRSRSRTDQCFILDEYAMLPKLSYLSRALTFGRSQGVQIIAAFQNVNQLYAGYGEFEARNMLGTFQTMIAFASTDPETRRYLAERFGENYENICFQPLSSTEPINVQRAGHTVEDADLLRLEDGEAIVSIVRSRPFLFKFPLYRA